MPNVFSPNADGHNDRFVPLDYTGEPGLLVVYNRWGQEVYSTRALAQGWDGAGLPDGTYYFVVTPDDPKVEGQAGHVTLVR
jgi:gliding motility-associated-like protein